MNRQLQLICAMLVFAGGTLFAQPANDNCGGAFSVEFSADEASVVTTDGDTRGATADLGVPIGSCSGVWFMDDIWFTITLPAEEIPEFGIDVKAFFGTEDTDVPAVGMAFYESCDSSAIPWICFSSDDPGVNSLTIPPSCLVPEGTYYVRVWSGVSANDNEGTLRVGSFPALDPQSEEVVLWEETFANGLDGWTTFGTCADADSNANATWKYLPQGLLDRGAFIYEGAGIESETVCNGAVGVDSDFDDNNGVGDFGAGPCAVPQMYNLESPVIYTGDWTAAGLTITWTQALRQFNSRFFVAFRTAPTGEAISTMEWTEFEINTDFDDGFYTDDVVRLFLGGAKEGDSLQLRFRYDANYYMWGIDDIRLVSTEAHNMRSMSNFFAVSPALNVPVGQEREFYPLNDIANIGSVAQTNVNLNFQVMSPAGNEIYNEDLGYGTIGPDSLAENVNFDKAVDYSGNAAGLYLATYTVTADSCQRDTDFDFSDNQNGFGFFTNMEGRYALENGATGGNRVADGSYTDGAPLSYTWGNYMYFPKGSECTVEAVTWGISNPDDIPGVTLNIILFKWIDIDGNQIVEAAEREIKGFAAVTINGDEGDNAVFDTELENFEGNPDDPITLEDGGEYLVMVEYNALDRSELFILSSGAVNYGAVALSSEQAGMPAYMAVLGHSPDGNIQGIDYEVTEFGDDGRIHFGNDLVPAVSLKLACGATSTKDVLAQDNLIEVYPNPTNQKLNVNLEFTTVHDVVQLQIMDVAGRLIETKRLVGIQSETLELNVSQYANGAYILQVQTEEGSRTKRFVVQH